MGTESERKFIVTGDDWRQHAGEPVRMQQGYFDVRDDATVRVRLVESTDSSHSPERSGELTIKGPPSGWHRLEFEYDIPPEDASDMLDAFCGGRVVRKKRFPVEVAGTTWTVDVFEDENDGLTLAEIELHEEQAVDRLAEVDPPDWIGTEVSHEASYTNGYLARHPYNQWD